MNVLGLGILRKFRRGFVLLLEKRWQVARGLACMPISALIVLWMANLLGQIVDSLRDANQDAGEADRLMSNCLLLAGLATVSSTANDRANSSNRAKLVLDRRTSRFEKSNARQAAALFEVDRWQFHFFQPDAEVATGRKNSLTRVVVS